jgi:hypothetical protein
VFGFSSAVPVLKKYHCMAELCGENNLILRICVRASAMATTSLRGRPRASTGEVGEERRESIGRRMSIVNFTNISVTRDTNRTVWFDRRPRSST